MNLSRMAWTRYRTKRDEPGGVRKVLRCKKIYPRLAANGARVATREAREGQKLHILPFFSKSLVPVYLQWFIDTKVLRPETWLRREGGCAATARSTRLSNELRRACERIFERGEMSTVSSIEELAPIRVFCRVTMTSRRGWRRDRTCWYDS